MSWVRDSLKEAMVICEILGREEEETWRKRLSVLRIGSENMIWSTVYRILVILESVAGGRGLGVVRCVCLNTM